MTLSLRHKRKPTPKCYLTGSSYPLAQLTIIFSDVLTTLKTTRSLFSSYLRIRSSASSATTPELTEARTELESTVTDLSTDLQDLVDSVRAVEGDPLKYGLDIEEVGRRRKLVQDVGEEVEGMRQELTKTVVGAQDMNGSLPPPSAFEADGDGGDDYGAFEQQRQVEMMHEQDEALDGVFKTVGNLRQQADDMGRELEQQGEILEDVDKLADRMGGKLHNGIKRVGWVIKNNEGEQLRLMHLSCRRTDSVELQILGRAVVLEF